LPVTVRRDLRSACWSSRVIAPPEYHFVGGDLLAPA
jgi:hypothetical protein